MVAENFPKFITLVLDIKKHIQRHQLYAESTISLSQTTENGAWLLRNVWKEFWWVLKICYFYPYQLNGLLHLISLETTYSPFDFLKAVIQILVFVIDGVHGDVNAQGCARAHHGNFHCSLPGGVHAVAVHIVICSGPMLLQLLQHFIYK